jgi:leucine dehydrogenase
MMEIEIFDLMKKYNQEQIAFYTDKTVKLRAMLAIHSTALGPAIGGIRIARYKSVEDAIFELTRLSQAMTFKAAAGGVNFGGGHIVVVEQEGMGKNEVLFRGLGRFIESFKGRFIAGEDIGVTDDAMEYMAMETEHLAGMSSAYGGIGTHSQTCAYGAYKGILAAAKYKWGNNDISGKKIIIQGYGRIGSRLAELVKKENANIVVTDIDEEKAHKAKENGYAVIAPEKIFTEKCHILAPCAVGPVINGDTAQKFQCEIIAGSANNQLLNDDDDVLLKKRGILYAPDFIINVGGIIDISEEYLGNTSSQKVKRKTENIYERLLEILKNADENNLSTNQAAIQYARKRIESLKQLKGTAITRPRRERPNGNSRAIHLS